MLDSIVELKRQQVAADKINRPLADFLSQVEQGTHAFAAALRSKPWSLIAECKLASPAKGTLCMTHTVPELAKLYEANGATALSIHTDPHFQGKLADLAAIRRLTGLPLLRKEFIIDEYQIYEGRLYGADAILLIAAVLTDEELQRFKVLIEQLGMDALVEVHSQEELERVLPMGFTLLGINNRNLKTFRTDIQTTFELLPLCPANSLVVSESGIRTGEDVRRLQQAGVKAALVGESLVIAGDIAAKVRELSNTERGE